MFDESTDLITPVRLIAVGYQVDMDTRQPLPPFDSVDITGPEGVSSMLPLLLLGVEDICLWLKMEGNQHLSSSSA